jgi:hypothetical protein
MFGHSLLVSDVRVTLGDGSELDCLQKIYPIGRFLVVGFAGDVKIGFAMVDMLRRWLHEPDEQLAWIPEETAALLPDIAVGIFAAFPDENRDRGCELILAGIHPTEKMGDSPWTRPSVYTFRAPTFQPRAVSMNEFVSIGSGGYVDEYREVLERTSGMNPDFMTIETMGRAAAHSGGSLLSMLIRKEMETRPTAGISRHFHICVVSLGDIRLGDNDLDTYTQSGEKIEFRMPRVARSWSELMEILQGSANAIAPIMA